MPTDSKSFVAGLAQRYGRRVQRFLRARLRDPNEASDLAQEVFIQLLRVQRHEEIRNPEAYVFTVASHIAHQHALRKSNEPTAVDLTEVFGELQMLAGEDPVDEADNSGRMARLETVLKGLPPRVATALVMHKIGGYTVQEIGDHLGVARETAKEYLARAAAYCRDHRAQFV